MVHSVRSGGMMSTWSTQARKAEHLRCLWRPDEDDASRIIASIEDSFVIGKIVCHLEARCCLQGPENRGPGARGPPPAVC